MSETLLAVGRRSPLTMLRPGGLHALTPPPGPARIESSRGCQQDTGHDAHLNFHILILRLYHAGWYWPRREKEERKHRPTSLKVALGIKFR